MSKKSFIDSVRVADPCTQDWGTMRGNERVRFCDHCAKSVTDLSKISRKQAKRLVRKSDGRLCVRYVKNPVTSAPVFADDFVQIQRRAPTFAAGVMSASLLLTTAGYAQGQVLQTPSPTSQQSQQSGDKKDLPNKDAEVGKALSSLSGTVVDRHGAVIPGAAVSVTNEKLNSPRSMASDSSGKFRFEDLEPGTYKLQTSASGFRTSVRTEIEVAASKEAVVDQTMEVADESVTVGGAMIVSITYNNPLMSAVSNDDMEAVRELIAKGERVNYRDKANENTTPLFLAVENGNVELVRMLLEFGAKVNARDSDKQTPLMRLDDDATAELVDLLLLYGAKVDLKDKDGNTALIIAAEDAKPEVIEALLRGSPDVNAANDEGQTALMNAANDDSLEKVKMLLLAGADVNAKNKEGDTAWDLTGEDDIEALLVSFGAIVEDDEAYVDPDQPVDKPVDN